MTLAASDVISRDKELAALNGFVASAESLPGALLLEGDAGIGKTTLLRAGIATAARSGIRVLSARPVEAESNLSFATIGDLLEQQLEDVLRALPQPQAHALEVALLLTEPAGPPPDRRAVGVGVLGALRELSSAEPLLLVIDDLQWLDRASAAALEFALRRLDDEAIGLLAAGRSGSDAPLRLERAFPEARLRRIPVGPLSLGALNTLLRDRLDAVFPRPTLRRIHATSGGNPFLALELARALERHGRSLEAGERLPVPDDVHELARDRLAALPPETVAALRAAAALSQPTRILVSAAADDRSALQPAIDAKIVELDGDRVRFTHPLLAAAAHGGAESQRALHGRLAELVGDPEERARHLALAATSPDPSVADGLEAAARGAAVRGATWTAAELTEQAARLTPPDRDEDVRRRSADAAYYHFESGDSRRARAMLEQLAGELSAGPERARVLVRLALTRAYDDDLHAASEINLQALEEAGDDSLTRARALVGLAATLFRRREHLAEAAGYARTAVELARGLGERALVGDALGVQLLSEAALGRSVAGATLEQLLRLRPPSDHIRLQAAPKWHAAIVRMWWEDLEWAGLAFLELVELGRERGDEAFLPYVYVLAAQNDCLRGDFERAAFHADAGREIAEQVGQETLFSYALAMDALVQAHLGHVDEARERGELALELARRTHGTPTLHFASWALGLLELSLNRTEAAAERLAPVVEFAREQEICEPSLTRFALDYVHALIELGRLEQAEAIRAWYEANAARLGRRGALASSARCLGLLAAARGDLDEALAILEGALADHEIVPMPFERARTLLALGSVRRRARQRRLARESLQRAQTIFEELGAALWARKAGAELSRISGRASHPGGLTPAELRIAELVGQGRSNKEVAAELVVTVRTVESNLTRIYRKLDVRSRAELAHRLSTRDPAEPL